MQKKQAIEVLAEMFKCPAEIAPVARNLGYTYQTLDQWPDTLTKAILHNIAGRCVGKRLPKPLIDAIKGAK